MNKFGLIGYPISHSLSPALFKAAYNGKYIYDLIEIEDFETAYQKFLDEYAVINVTAPFKEPAFKKADIVSEECRAIGATNILMKREDGKIVAGNSDHLGVSGAIAKCITARTDINKVALIVGCGGAAKAAAYATAALIPFLTAVDVIVAPEIVAILDTLSAGMPLNCSAYAGSNAFVPRPLVSECDVTEYPFTTPSKVTPTTITIPPEYPSFVVS